MVEEFFLKQETDLLNLVDKKRNEIIELARSLVRIPSVTGEEGVCQDFLAGRLKRLAAKVDVFEPDIDQLKKHPEYSSVERSERVKLRSYDGRPNVVATLKGSGGGKSLILCGHVDVVPTGPVEMWTHDPWGGQIDNGKLYGRGALDMKGGLAAMIAAAEIVSEADSLRGDLILECVVDEETGGNGTLACLQRGYTADACILTEPSQLFRGSIVLASRGASQYRITVKGRSGHPSTSYPEPGYVSAIDKASKILGAIKDFNSIRQEDVQRLNHPLYRMYPETNLVGVGKMSAGEWFSMMPNICVIEGSIECSPGENIEEIKSRFADYIRNFAELDPWMKQSPPEVEWFGLHIVPTEVRTDEPIVATIEDSVRRILKVDPILFGFAGGSDQRIFTEYGHIPAVQFGPSGGGEHAVEEFVVVDDIIEVTKVLVSVISKWCILAT